MQDYRQIQSDRKFWREQTTALIMFCFIFCMLFVGSLVSWYMRSKMEAEVYSRVTGKPVTTWDAMWVEFRINEGVE